MLTTILGLITIILILIILFQISKASEMLATLKGEDKSMNMANKGNALMFMLFLIFGLVGSVWSTFHYADLFLPVPSSVHGIWLRNMFFWTLVATVPVFIVTHIALFYFTYKYQHSKDRKSYYYPHNNKLELIWTVIPSIVLILLVYEGIRNWYKITGEAPKSSMIVEATAQQFMWNLRYSGADNQLGSKTVKNIGKDNGLNVLGQIWTDAKNHDDFLADELHLPINKPVLVKINSIDVLHSFYLPHFRVKMDAVPGIPTQFWFIPTKTTEQMRQELDDPTFNYELACAELCGQAHFNMRRVVVVEEEAEFEAWKAKQKTTYAKIKEAAAAESGTASAAEKEDETKEMSSL